MDIGQIQFIGSPCGYHGPYTFYKAFKYLDEGKNKILSIGEFFFLKILEDIPVCIGEIQLLWEEKGTNQLLASVRLYFKPQDTPDGEDDCFGEDELLAVSEKLILTVADLCQLLIYGVSWPYGHKLHCVHDLKDSDETMVRTGGIADDIGQAFVPSNRGLYLEDVEKAREETDYDERDPRAPVVVMSYPQYCRYRAVLKRLETVTDKWLKNALVMAVGGFSCQKRGVRVMFCREVCDYPELDDLDIRMDHLAPNLKGRPRKRRLLSRKDCNQDSDSNDYGSDQSSTTSSTCASARVKCQKVLSKNGVIPARQNASQEEKEFLTSIHKFMDKRNSPIDRLPSLGFKQIDLYLFYKAAQQLGGYDKITNKRLWKVLYDNLGGNPGNTSAATCTRRHYEKLILPYEKHVHRMRGRQQQNKQLVSDLNLPSSEKKESGLTSQTNSQGQEAGANLESDIAKTAFKNQLSSKMKATNVQASCSQDLRGYSIMQPKVCNVEDMYEVKTKSCLLQQQTPLEIPVVRQRVQTSIMSPIIPVVRQRVQTSIMSPIRHRKVVTPQDPQYKKVPAANPGPKSPSGCSQETQSRPVQSILRAPEYSSHLSSSSISSASLPHTHTRASNHLQHLHSKHEAQHPHRRQSQHHHPPATHNTVGAPQNHDVQQMTIKPAHCSSATTVPHTGLIGPTQMPELCTQPFSASHPGPSVFHPPPDTYYGPSLPWTLAPPPPPAHSSARVQALYHGDPSMLFPPPDQVLSRIQVLHHPQSTVDPQSASVSVSVKPDPAGSIAQDMPVDLSSVHCSNFTSRERLSGASRAAERKPRAPMHYIGTCSANSSSSLTAPCKSTGIGVGTSREMSEDKEPQEVLQSALFGAQFTALPRPVKPTAAASAGETTHGVLPTVHPAFMQALWSSPSSLNIYAPQFSVMQQAAYEELVRQKAISSMVTAHPPYIMATFPANFSHSTEDSPK